MATPSRLCPALLGLLCATAPAAAADLAAVDRSLKKEPAYQGKPKYCLLVFGPEARTRVWLVQDGEVLYVDRNGNGDLTEKGKRVERKQGDKNFRVFEAGDLADGPLTHTGLTVTQVLVNPEVVGNPKEFERIKAQGDRPWTWWVRVAAERPADDRRPLPRHIKYIVNGDGLGYLLFADRPQDAPVIHLNGPWTLGLQDVKQRLTAGDKTMLQIGVGTPGVGPGTFTFVLYPDTIPADVYPAADVAFPPRSPGEEPIREKFVLKQRC
jgi:hypothetical protein